MSKTVKTCILKCIKTPSLFVNLPHATVVNLGRRDDEFKIADIHLSRKQLAVTADYTSSHVDVEVLGTNASGCNGYALLPKQKYKLRHGDQLELLLGKHELQVEFENELSESESGEPPRKKMKGNFEIFNTSSKDASSKGESSKSKHSWKSIDKGDLIIYEGNFERDNKKKKVAAFDLDGTLIDTKSGNRFPKDQNDWKIKYGSISSKLIELSKDHTMVIFTNQAGLRHDSTKVRLFKEKLEKILEALKVSFQIFIATTLTSGYRKPTIGMWNAFCQHNDSLKIDLANSFYVGDAAGRGDRSSKSKGKDHSVADRLFALNIGLKFYTPEEYFLNSSPAPFSMPKFDPKNLPNITDSSPEIGKMLEIIVMVGCQGSGKSYFCDNNLKPAGYVYANRDKLGTWQACAKIVEKALSDKQSVVVDNTNSDKASRKRYIDVAKQAKVQCRCFIMTTSFDHCKHNNRFRELTDKKHAQVGLPILNAYKKNFEEPTIEEGFNEIVKVDFVPNFSNEEDEKLYRSYLLES